MYTEYLIVREYDLEVLLPIDNTTVWSEFMKEVKIQFKESADYKEAVDYPEFVTLKKAFDDFLSRKYSAINKLLIQDITK